MTLIVYKMRFSILTLALLYVLFFIIIMKAYRAMIPLVNNKNQYNRFQ